MKLVRVAAATLNQTPLDWDRNRANILEAIARARRAGASLLCLPELCITGYGCEDAFLSQSTLSMAERVLAEIVPETTGLAVSLGLPIQYKKRIFNTCCLVADGRPLGLVAKHSLAGDGVHYEPRWFKAWPLGKRVDIELAGQALPLGDVRFDCGGVGIGFEICEDAWVAQRPAAQLGLDGVDVIFNPSASHFAFGKHQIRRRLVLEGSRAFGVSYVYSNLLGNEAGRVIYDGDALIATSGRVVARTERFRFDDVALISAVVDVELTRFQYARLTGVEPELEASARASVAVPFEYPGVAPEPESAVERPAWEAGAVVKEEEFSRAIALGLFDYLCKSGVDGFVISLSGGADSAAVTCLARLMLRFAVEQLGLSGVLEKLNRSGSAIQAADEAELGRRLVTTVYQGTRNSSELTRNAARAVAAANGTTHYELDVDSIVEQYQAMVAAALGQKLSWESHDVSLQNIQARARAPGAWLIANVKRALLLSASNRSEAAVGYATMDGDTAGGLSPIAGIDKAFLRRWLAWLEHTGPAGVGPLPALEAVTRQAPTAELRPAAAGQTDEADLMPYELLDAIERAAIRDKRGPVEVFRQMRAVFPHYASDALAGFVERFFVLWCKNQWKRERYAPSFHVDDANLDPKTWCRFPILSGRFERELAELRAVATGNPTGGRPERLG